MFINIGNTTFKTVNGDTQLVLDNQLILSLSERDNTLRVVQKYLTEKGVPIQLRKKAAAMITNLPFYHN